MNMKIIKKNNIKIALLSNFWNSLLINLSVITCLASINTYTTDAHAEDHIANELGNIWTSLGGQSVSNAPNYYKGQKAGHYTMGSMYFARPKKNRPLVSVTYPEFDFDNSCYSQGVLNFGGASFISGEELKNKLNSIAQQSGMMFAYLGLSSISPVFSEALQEVYSKLQELGGFLADECQAAKQIVSFAGDKLSQHSEKAKDIFTKMRLNKGENNDLSNLYKQFPSGKSEALKEAAEKDETLIIEDVNLAWKALSKLKITNNEIKEFMMTVSGTIIIKAPENDTRPPKFQYISSKVTSPSLLDALLKGKQSIKIISCYDHNNHPDHNKCLIVSEKNKFLEEKDSFEKKVLDFFDLIKEALVEDKELRDDAKHFLANAGIPAYAIYEKLYQYTSGNPEYEQGVLVEIVAWNILYNYLHDMLSEVNEAANNLQISASSELKEFKESLRSAQKLLAEHEMKDLSRYKLQLFMVKRAESMEDSMASDIAQVLNMAKSSR